MQNRTKKIWFEFLLALFIILALSSIFWVRPDIDIKLESYFYREGQGWYMKKDLILQLIYKFGIIPAILAGIYSMVILIFSYTKKKKYYKYRKFAAFVFLLFTLGPGLVINGVLKAFWGRPRPRHIVQFGGIRKYIKVGVPSREYPKPNSSFPCGHASVAFFFFFPFFIYRKKKKGVACLWLAFGISYGMLMGFVRMAQGGHFASDVLWAGGITYLIGSVLCNMFEIDEKLMME